MEDSILNKETINSSIAQDLTGKAILFEIGAKAGILDLIEDNEIISVSEISRQLDIPEDFVTTYLETFENLQLLSRHSNQINYIKSPDYEAEKNKIGYLCWGMMSCAPLIANTKAFTANFDNAVNTHHRCGEHVARTSKWMGEVDFYPHAESVICDLKPRKMVDLGSGTCGLLIRLAGKIKGLAGVGVDLSKDACEQAKIRLQNLGLDKQIQVIEAPIQALVENNSVFRDADVVHAGFVFHDLMPDEEETLDALLACINKTAPKAILVIVDAVPFAKAVHERSFSSAFTFLHKFFMGRRLQSEEEWHTKLAKAGYTDISIKPLGISGGRVFVAKNAVA